MQARIPEVTLLEEVGRGPGSIVFRALHRGACCTVKLPTDRSPVVSTHATTFEQDMLELARLSRAGLPRVLLLGGTSESPYAIVEQAHGEALPSFLRRSLNESAALTLVHTLATYVQRLHDAGFVHGNLTAEHVLVSEHGTRVAIIDKGSMVRVVPFDARADLRALGLLIRDIALQIDSVGGARPLLSRLSEGLISGHVLELSNVVAELDSRCDSDAQRRSSYPPPSRESLALPASAPRPRRARGEIRVLRRFWEQAADQGGRLIGVLGPPGSGKSRLLAVFAEEIGAEQVQVLSVKCRDSDWAPFSALKRLLEGHLAGLSGLDPARRAQLEENLRSAAGGMASRIRLLSPRLDALLADSEEPIAHGDAQQVFVTGVADFLAKYLEASAPSVLVIDDVHWLDASSRMVFSRLAARLCAQGHVLVCAARDDADCREPLERFRAMLVPELTASLQLDALCEEDASDIIADYLGLDRPADRELVQQLTQLSDGTPLNLIELLRVTLDRGFLRPLWGRWLLDAAAAQRMRLPPSSHASMRRRLARLEEPTLDVLRAAAVLRNRIDAKVLARVHGTPIEAVLAALDAAWNARLLEKSAEGDCGFVHDFIREELLRGTSEGVLRGLHERAAEALYVEEGHGAEYEYELALHHAAGLIDRNPRRAFDATRTAAHRALEAGDDALALSFLKPAAAAAKLANIEPDRQFYVALAETSLRLGHSSDSRAYFECALARSRPGFERAHVLGRIAWFHHFESEAEACVRALEMAFAECGRPIPSDHPRSLVRDAAGWLTSAVQRGPRLRREDAETLCELLIACARISFDSGRRGRGVACVVQLSRSARQLGPCRTRVHADLLLAFVLSSLKATQLSDVLISRAEASARELGDPVAQTSCHQLLHLIWCLRGDLEEAERHARMCVDERSQWLEVGELCHLCLSMHTVDLARGRPIAAYTWLDKAIARVRQGGRAPAIFELIEQAAYSTLLALGRDKEIARLKRQLEFIECGSIQPGSCFHWLSYQSRVQLLTERGELGTAFEALVDEFDNLGHNAQQANAWVLAFYIHVAHARVHQCLRAEPARRALLLPKLERVLRQLDTASRVAIYATPHACFVRAAYHWFCGSRARGETLLVEAERLAQDHDVVWVSCAAARLRAHMLRASGKLEAARNQAQVAAMLARQYGHSDRLRVFREEFELSEWPEPVRNEVDAPYTRRHLAALLRISQANSRELGPERQARVILDELLETLGAERALLFMRGDSNGSFALTAARALGGCDLEPDADYDPALVEQVYVTGQTQLAETDYRPGDERACVVVALVLREQAVGALYLDRPEGAGGFRPEDAALLQALANQVPIALELASALRERERLQQNLRQAQKMEAIGRLTGGIAHDFNNILAAIQFAAESLATLLSGEQEGLEEVNDIQDSARRGAELTRQLLTFSRGKTVPPQRIVLGDVVRELTPMLRRLVRADVRLEIDVEEQPLPTFADPSHIERVLMNLCQNASDAMPQGGTINVRVEAAGVETIPPLGAELRHHDNYVMLTVADTGMGMNDEVRTRLFEPFFTTKAGGTGLGLANVYAIVQQCGGQIEVASEPGVGSTFRIYLPRVDTLESSFATLSDESIDSLEPEDLGAATVLVVEDDDSLRRDMVSTLEGAGYQVLSATDGADALALVDALDGLVDVALTDLRLPDTGGMQLADALLQRDPDIKLLFVSGEQPDEASLQDLRDRNGAFMPKPFSVTGLLDTVGSMLRMPPGAMQGH